MATGDDFLSGLAGSCCFFGGGGGGRGAAFLVAVAEEGDADEEG